MQLIGTCILAVLGPAAALIVTWKPSVDITNIDGDKRPPADIVQKLRSVPTDGMLDEIDDVSVGAWGLGDYAEKEIIAAAEQALKGRMTIDGDLYDINVPKGGFNAVFDRRVRSLKFCSLIVPNLLASAFDVSGDVRYLKAAVEYLLAWSKFESSLPFPIGCLFSDHATAARAIVVTELWRQYRNSSIFDLSHASELLLYVKTLSHLLQYEPLYEYRTNHGIMQNLSLLHLGIAFPLLAVADQNLETGRRRLLSQLEYYVNEEGVILEHSPGYHQNGLLRLAAGWRYLGLLDEPVPDSFVGRYRRALDFRLALRRPDRTLPPIGDTGEQPYSTIQVATFDRDSIVSAPLQDERDEMPAPEPVTVAPGAGWIILWDGLAHWPDASQMAQTILHWGNFATKAHKHADELAVSLWSNGAQWLRGVGYWPYGPSRVESIGWRSSNAPHWLNESSLNERYSRLVGSVIKDKLSFFEVLRSNHDGSRIRRQLVKIDDDTWVLLDSFKSLNAKTAEIVWRFPANVTVEETGERVFTLKSDGARRSMNMQAECSVPVEIDVDTSGTATWNSGVMVDGEATASPAIRTVSSASDPIMLTVFGLDDGRNETAPRHLAAWRWESEANWQFSLTTVHGTDITVERDSNTIRVLNGAPKYREWKISTSLAESASAPRRAALVALKRTSEAHGVPYKPMVDRRIKVTVAIAVTAIAQLMLFFFVRQKQNSWWLPLAICSSVAWIALSLYLGTSFLV